MLVLTGVLLRPALRPLSALTTTMRRIDPLEPGRRVPVVGSPDVAALAQAFNDMLARLERERRESGRRALAVQEAERARVARELHDEVGQVFTAIMLQIESLAPHVDGDVRHGLDGLRSALTALATSFGRQTQIRTERAFEPGLPLDREQELVVYRWRRRR